MSTQSQEAKTIAANASPIAEKSHQTAKKLSGAKALKAVAQKTKEKTKDAPKATNVHAKVVKAVKKTQGDSVSYARPTEVHLKIEVGSAQTFEPSIPVHGTGVSVPAAILDNRGPLPIATALTSEPVPISGMPVAVKSTVVQINDGLPQSPVAVEVQTRSASNVALQGDVTYQSASLVAPKAATPSINWKQANKALQSR